jgi:tRNA(Ile)-lysidine synthetase-like protein
VDFEALERASTLRAVDVAGGLCTLIEGETFYLAAYEADLPAGKWPQLDGEQKVGSGETPMGDGWILSLEERIGETVYAEARDNGDPFTAWLDADLVAGSPSTGLRTRLRVRPFRAGDRFEPLGMAGMSVKLSDLFVNLKIPKRMRKSWPLVCVDDEIAWVAGLRLAEKYKVTEKTSRVVKLGLKRLP